MAVEEVHLHLKASFSTIFAHHMPVAGMKALLEELVFLETASATDRGTGKTVTSLSMSH